MEPHGDMVTSLFVSMDRSKLLQLGKYLNPSYFTINIFQCEEDAFICEQCPRTVGLVSNLATLNVMVFFCDSQGKMNLRSAEEKQGNVIHIGR